MVERRHLRRRSKDTDGSYLTVGEFRSWKRRATAAFVALTLIASGSAAWAYKEGTRADDAILRNARDAVYDGCTSRAELRVTVAVGMDELRRFALPKPRSARERAYQQNFIERTQVPIDRLLFEAAGGPVAIKPGPIPETVRLTVRSRAIARCKEQATAFEPGAKDGNGPSSDG